MIQNPNQSTTFTPYTVTGYGNPSQPANTNIVKTQEQTQIGLANGGVNKNKTTKEGNLS